MDTHTKHKRITIIKQKKETTMKLHIAAFLLLSSCVQSQPRKLLREALKHKHIAAESRIVGGTMTDPGKFPFFGKKRLQTLFQSDILYY
jgi:hypothetical protein